MHVRDIVAQVKAFEVTVSNSLQVCYILFILSH